MSTFGENGGFLPVKSQPLWQIFTPRIWGTGPLMSKAASSDVQNSQLLHLLAADLAWQWPTETPSCQLHTVPGRLMNDSEAMLE